MWAKEKSYTLTFKTSGSNSDSNTAWSNTSNVSDVLTAGDSYVSSISAASNVYPARDGRGAKFGTSSKAGSITFALSSDGQVKATKVVIKGGAYISSSKAEAAAVKVNSGTAVAFNSAVTSYTEEDITYNFTTATDITFLTLAQNKADNGRLYIVSVTVYYEEDEGEGVTASWSLDPTSANVMAGESTSLQLTTNYDGTLTFTSNATSIANVSYNSSSKVITVTGVAAGKTTISATGDATATYNAINKVISVTVNRVEVAYNATEIITDLGYQFWDEIAAAEGSADEINGRQNGVTIKVEKASGTAPRADAAYLRFYKKSDMTITAPAGSYITKIVFTEPDSGASWSGSMTVDDDEKGEYVSDDKTWYATVENVTSVKLTGQGNTKRIGGVKVYLYKTIPISISDAGYATLYSDKALDFTGTGITAYVAAVDGNNVSFEEVTSAPAETGLLLKGEAKAYNIPVTASPASVTSALVGTLAETTVPAGTFVLFKKGEKVGFYKTTAEEFTVGANTAWLPADVTPSRNFIGFDDETTGIEELKNSKTEELKSYYNLNGQRVANPTKGLYIVNGKKVIINK